MSRGDKLKVTRVTSLSTTAKLQAKDVITELGAKLEYPGSSSCTNLPGPSSLPCSWDGMQESRCSSRPRCSPAP